MPGRSSFADALRAHWRVPLGLVILLGGGFALLRLADRVDVWYQAAAWLLLVLVFILLVRKGIEALVGPVLFFDLVRTARRGRYALLRSFYVLLLLFVLFMVYTKQFGLDPVSGLANIMDEQTLPPSEMATFAAAFFHVFLVVQFVVIVILAPAFTAGAVAEEKEKRTLPDLLTTELTGREIIVGKLLSRVSHLILLLLGGLPILSLLQLLGGVDPSLLAAGFALTVTTAVGVGAIGVLCSVHCAKPRDAVFLTYVIVATVQFLSTFVAVMFYRVDFASPVGFGAGTVLVGNIPWAYYQLTELSQTGQLPDMLPWVLLQYIAFNGCLTFACVLFAMLGLRRKALPDEGRRLPPGAIPVHVYRRQRVASKHPRLGDRPPMVWKECYVEPGLQLHPAGQQILSMVSIIVLSLVGTLFFCGVAVTALGRGGLPGWSNDLMRYCVPGLATIGLLGMALRAAGTFSSEREKQTLDSLLTSDLTANEILLAKAWGCLWSMKTLGLVLAVMIGIGTITAGIFPPFVVLLVLALAAQSAFVIALGTYCSLVSKTTLRATVGTISVMLAVMLGHELVLLIEKTLCHIFSLPHLSATLDRFHTFGLTPPLTLATFIVTFTSSDLTHGELNVDPDRIIAGVWGTVFYGVLALLLWWRVRSKFAAVTGRLR